MSGIVGILHLDGAPVEGRLLQNLTEAMAFRGPQAQAIWAQGRVGLGHALLPTTFESQREQQPCSLDGEVWITADARLDDRAGLQQRLAPRGGHLAAATDAELILHAYQAWGEECVQHILGDFCFALWDGRQQRLFCARDHFGVKLFYFAQAGNTLVFSNTLNVIRQHPAVSRRLHEPAIGDFLLFGYNVDAATTTFADIRRLMPAQILTASGTQVHARRYWQLPITEPLRFTRPADCVDRFKELLQQAVTDRLRTDGLTVWMSGGLDSTSVAALAAARQVESGRPATLTAMSVYYDDLIPDDEREYAELAGRALNLPIHFLPGDRYPLFEGGSATAPHYPEPVEEPMTALLTDQLQTSLANGNVVLTGDGGDELLFPSGLAQMARSMPLPQVWHDAFAYVRSHKELPPLGLGLRAKLRAWRQRAPVADDYPNWLNQGFAQRCGLPERWRAVTRPKAEVRHPLRPGAYYRLTMPYWQSVLEFNDPGVTGAPLEFRLPYLDLRLVNFTLALPPLPWFVDKELLRRATAGLLPEQVRRRPKTALREDSVVNLLQREKMAWLDDFTPVPALAEFVTRAAVPKVTGRPLNDGSDPYVHLRPFVLNRWLQHIQA
ncbi:MAG: Asparagine synthetase [glutamine-hydrolyzing] 3 [bacterium]|nr:Asparagine synthetase [glutamine-hydrolyzing] 3 [bacterium]